jgi:catechol 2,3-dioxygenase-like lactoylglutathione lyase family enzyme
MRIFNLILGFTLLIAINNFGQNNKSAMEQRMSFITLGVENLDKSVDFYENKFGWKRSELSNDKMILFQLNGILLSLYDRHKLAEDATVDSTGSGFKGFTISYLTRNEKEVDDLIAKLKKQNVRIVKEPQKVFWGGYSSYISDPDGYLWEIAFNPYAIPK